MIPHNHIFLMWSSCIYEWKIKLFTILALRFCFYSLLTTQLFIEPHVCLHRLLNLRILSQHSDSWCWYEFFFWNISDVIMAIYIVIPILEKKTNWESYEILFWYFFTPHIIIGKYKLQMMFLVTCISTNILLNIGWFELLCYDRWQPLNFEFDEISDETRMMMTLLKMMNAV